MPTKKEKQPDLFPQFRSRANEDLVSRKAKKMRLTNKDVGHGEERPMCANEVLCPDLKKLLSIAVIKKHECNWKYVWSFNLNIFSKEGEGTPIFPIRG